MSDSMQEQSQTFNQGMKQPQMGNQGMQQPQMGNQGMQQPQMGNQDMQQPVMNGQGMKQPQMESQGMQQPQMGDQSMQQPQMGDQGMQQPQMENKSPNYPEQQPITQETQKAVEAINSCTNEILNTMIRPALCCLYPLPMIDYQTNTLCMNECERDQDPEECLEKCLHRHLKLYDGLMGLITESWSEFFFRYLDLKDITRGDWSVIVPESVIKCSEELMKKFHQGFPKNIQLVGRFVRSCIFRRNYVACPKLKNMPDCKKSQEFFKKENSCYMKFEPVINLRTIWS